MNLQKTLSIFNKLLSVIAGVTLIFWASLISIFFFLSSLFEILIENNFVFSVYILALIFLIIHLILRNRFPDRFIKKSRRQLNMDKLNDLLTDLLFRMFSALASSVAIFTLIWPEKIRFFINDWQALSEKIAFSFVIWIILVLFFITIVPVGITFLASKLVPGSFSQLRRKYFVMVLGLIFVLLFLLHSEIKDYLDQPTIIELLTDRILKEKIAVDIIKYLLGIPLFFWLTYLFLGIEWLKAKQ